MMSWQAYVPSDRDIERLRREAGDNDTVILLGRRVQAALSAAIPDALQLPHPASRRRSDLDRLEAGLRALDDH